MPYNNSEDDDRERETREEREERDSRRQGRRRISVIREMLESQDRMAAQRHRESTERQRRILEDVRDHESRLRSLERFRNWVAGIGTALMVLAAKTIRDLFGTGGGK